MIRIYEKNLHFKFIFKIYHSVYDYTCFRIRLHMFQCDTFMYLDSAARTHKFLDHNGKKRTVLLNCLVMQGQTEKIYVFIILFIKNYYW